MLCLFHGKIVALKSDNLHRISDSTKLNSLQALLGMFYHCKSNKFSLTEKQICVLGLTKHLNKLSSFHAYTSHTLNKTVLSCKQVFKDIFSVHALSESCIYQNIPHLPPKKMWKTVKIRRQKLLITLMKR